MPTTLGVIKATVGAVLFNIEKFFGKIVGESVDIGNKAINTGSNLTSGSVYGVPVLTVSMIAITSVIMAYVTAEDVTATSNTPFGIISSIKDLVSPNSSKSEYMGGKNHKSRKTRVEKKRTSTQKKGGK